ncbi:FAD-binding oxidoreductase [Sandaracinobacteroides saxicola]|uniref:FAD-binding oxidoreductase n=1 Tax=Sandaracinobacteroides saxicola TaxID=2759707 RepID=A0A7G5IDM5_9SPHN|nr:FAD-binding oxidoreductase [Sandaracinobacteroides saxicola]QMW21467.1 FAD-binding oxidoreductase [Sandaracinobacteroides saxicola]
MTLEALRAAGVWVSTTAEDIAPRLTDWRGATGGPAAALLKPASIAEVVAVVRAAGEHGVPLVPQGGRTGLVGGGLPGAEGGAWIVSLERMRAIRQVDAAGLSATVEAGVVLQALHDAAAKEGCVFPLSLGAKGSATIGGLISTNAGGVQVLRHGTMRALVLGLEAVLPDGSVLNQLGGLRKDNSGYDIKQLLIGGEGTLGIVTAATLRLVPAPAARAVAWVGLHSPAEALALLRRVRGALGEAVESFEIMPAAGLALVLRHIEGVRAPLAGAHAWHALIEVTGRGAPEAMLGEVLMAAPEVEDAVVAASDAQAAALWRLREELPEAERRDGGAIKNDVSIAVADLPAFYEAVVAVMAGAFPTLRVMAFGHLGDGNLHLNFRAPEGVDDRAWVEANRVPVRRVLHDLIADWGGSISAEHGIGTLKAAELARLGDPGKLAAMRAVKAALDPKGIMNPGKILV